MMNLKKLCVFAVLAVPLAAGAQAISLTSEQTVIDKAALNAYAKENLSDFTVSSLDNGIPVVIKKNASNRILTLKTVLVGQSSLTPVDKAGLEAIMLAMLTRGSQHFTYAQFQEALFEDSASITPSTTSFDMSSFDLFTIDTYFDKLFDVYADAFLHPVWNADEFPKVIGDFKLAKQQSLMDPYGRAVNDVNVRFFTGHPYAASWDGTMASLGNITLDDVKSYYNANILSGRMFIVAVGNFDAAKLLQKLNSTFGTLPKKPFTRPAVAPFAGTVKPDLISEDFPQSEGLAYMRADFALPSPDSPDFPQAQVAFALLDDLLFEVVRTENGACYSVWSGIHPFSASYGDLTVYKTAVPGAVKQYVNDSIAVLLGGKCLAGQVSASAEGKSGIGTEVSPKDQKAVFVPISEALPFYKAQFLATFYSGQETNASVASQIASSVIYHGDYRDYLFVMDRVNAVDAAGVVQVAQKYLRDNPMLWIALGDPALLKAVKKEDYTGSMAQ